MIPRTRPETSLAASHAPRDRSFHGIEAEPDVDNQRSDDNPSIVNVSLNQLFGHHVALKAQDVSCDDDVAPTIRPVLS